MAQLFYFVYCYLFTFIRKFENEILTCFFAVAAFGCGS